MPTFKAFVFISLQSPSHEVSVDFSADSAFFYTPIFQTALRKGRLSIKNMNYSNRAHRRSGAPVSLGFICFFDVRSTCPLGVEVYDALEGQVFDHLAIGVDHAGAGFPAGEGVAVAVERVRAQCGGDVVGHDLI